MNFGVGDIVPYNQLPGAVAGTEAAQIPQAYNKGQMDAASLESALAKAKMDDINTNMTVARLPQEIAMKNIQDLQSINTMPPRPTLDHVNQAEKDVLGDAAGTREPTAMERHKIQIRSEELAREDAPKPDIANPMDYLMQVNPVSNREVQYESALAQSQGRYGVHELDNDAKLGREQLALDTKQKFLNQTEAGKNARVGLGGAGANLKGQTAADRIIRNFKTESLIGKIPLDNPQADDFLSKPAAKQEIMNVYQELLNTDKPSAQRFFAQYGKYMPGMGAPAAANTVTPGPNGTQIVKAAPEQHKEGDVIKKTGNKVVRSIGQQVYGVGDQIWHNGALWEITEGDGSRAGMRKVKQ